MARKFMKVCNYRTNGWPLWPSGLRRLTCVLRCVQSRGFKSQQSPLCRVGFFCLAEAKSTPTGNERSRFTRLSVHSLSPTPRGEVYSAGKVPEKKHRRFYMYLPLRNASPPLLPKTLLAASGDSFAKKIKNFFARVTGLTYTAVS